MTIAWFTENYPPNSGGMAHSADRIVHHLRKTCTVHVFHFTNKFEPFFSEANIGGTYTALPVYPDSAHTLNVLWSFIEKHPLLTAQTILVSYGSSLCQRGLPLISKWLNLPLLTCFRGNDFDTGIFSAKKQHILYAIEHSAAVACVTSEKVARIKALGLNNHVYFTPNSIDLQHWEVLKEDILLAETIQQPLPATTIRLGLIGYQKPKKGIDFFLEALVLSEINANVFLQFVGEISPETETLLQQKSINYSLALPNSKTKLLAHYLGCDAIVIPSIYDGMPNVLLEAAALKIPIIASRAGGIADVLTNDNAYLFKTLSQSELIEALNNFQKATKKEVTQKTESLFNKIKTKYTPTLEIENYLNIFKGISK